MLGWGFGYYGLSCADCSSDKKQAPLLFCLPCANILSLVHTLAKIFLILMPMKGYGQVSFCWDLLWCYHFAYGVLINFFPLVALDILSIYGP